MSLRKELLEQWRTYRLLIATAVLLLFGLLSPVIAKFAPRLLELLPGGTEIARLIPSPTVADAVGQYVKNASQFGIILALLMSMGTVAREKDKGTAAMVLSKPLPRASFLLAKFAACAVTFLTGVALAGAACYCYTILLFQAVDPLAWLALNGLLALYLLVCVSITLLFSTFSRSQVLAGGLSFAVIVVFGALGAVPAVGKWLPADLINRGVSLALGSTAGGWQSLWVSCIIIALALLGSLIVFRRQEL